MLNYTPHNPLRIFAGENVVAELPAASRPVRLKEITEPWGELTIEGREVPVVTMSYGDSDELPSPAPGTALVVSQLVCQAHPDRDDLFFPVDLVRNAAGDIVGCRRLAKLKESS